MDMWNLEQRAPVSVLRSLYRLAGRRVDPFRAHEHEHRAIFIHVPKAAGRSVSEAFTGQPGGARHVPIKRYMAVDPGAVSDYFVFTFVRHPFDRFRSAFDHAMRDYRFARHPVDDGIQRDPAYVAWAAANMADYSTVDEFVDWIAAAKAQREVLSWLHFRPQHCWIACDGKLAVDWIGHFEALADDWAEIAARLNLSRTLPSGRMPQRSKPLGEASEAVVREMYETDFALLGY